MSLTVPIAVLEHSKHAPTIERREQRRNWRDEDVRLSGKELTDDALADLAAAAEIAGNRSMSRVIASITAARAGDFTKGIPKFDAAQPILTEFLRANIIDGWLYRQAPNGRLYPHLVTAIDSAPATPHAPAQVTIRLLANGSHDGLKPTRTTIALAPENITRKRAADILLAEGYLKETPELKAQYEEDTETYRLILTEGFAKQYRYTGIPSTGGYWGRAGEPRENRKVIHDVHPREIPAHAEYAASTLFEGSDETDRETFSVPIHPTVKVFDLHTHDSLWVNALDMAEHVYDHSLAEKLVLPEDQRELLDILTTDITTFTSDIIEGKSAGNVILCKGVPGVGKTLTAEVYAELIDRPLYSIHSGSLGTTAADVRKNLEAIFGRAQRWDAVLLLDEADVFVMSRGDNMEQNAVVAEFLRTMEYFSGLLFATTNRADDIDEAILSRCAAIIDYKIPVRADAERIWQVLAKNSNATLSDELLTGLLDGLPDIAPRDIKMLLRLALRVAAHKDEELTLDVFRRCAMFRGLRWDVRTL